GLGPGLVATGLSLILGRLFFMSGESLAIHTVGFGLLGIAFSVVFGWSRRAAQAEWMQRKNAQEQVQFFLDLNEALLPLADADQIMAMSVRMLGERLGVDRCAYAEAKAGMEEFVVLAYYTGGGPSGIAGEYDTCDVGDEGERILSEDRPY